LVLRGLNEDGELMTIKAKGLFGGKVGI